MTGDVLDVVMGDVQRTDARHGYRTASGIVRYTPSLGLAERPRRIINMDRSRTRLVLTNVQSNVIINSNRYALSYYTEPAFGVGASGFYMPAGTESVTIFATDEMWVVSLAPEDQEEVLLTWWAEYSRPEA